MTPVLIPWRPGDPHRERVFAHCRAWYERAGFDLVTGESPAGPFSRAAALHDAARRADPWDVAVIIDADTLVEPDQVAAAVTLARASEQLVIAWTELHNLSARGSEQILGGYRRSWRRFARWTNTRGVSSCLAVPRPVWDAVGGFDQRFRGWGWEDRAFYLACRTLTGAVHRIEGPAWHLWHARSAEKDPARPEYQAGYILAERYRRAARSGPDEMRALLAER